MANQLPTADEAFGPAPLPPEEDAERETPRHEGGPTSIRTGGLKYPQPDEPTSGLFVDLIP
jgi:hypothetical protein